MAEVIKVRNVPAQHIGVVNSAPSPEMNIVAKEITENGRYEARTEGVTGFDPVIVNVPSREEIGYENGYAAGYDKGSADGYADALANRTELEVTANGEYIPEGEITGFSKVSVNVPTGAENEDALISGTLSGDYRNDRVTEVALYGLYSQELLTSLDLPSVTTIGNYAFNRCTKLTTISLPLATSIPQQALARCSELTNVYIPLVASTGTQAFGSCGKLKTIDMPSCTKLGSNTFDSCYKLEKIDLQSVSSISSGAFSNCRSLKSLIIRDSKLCSLASVACFTGCYHILGTADATYNPEGLKDGYIYVPDDLVEDYKVATNWSTYASQIKPISELEG